MVIALRFHLPHIDMASSIPTIEFGGTNTSTSIQASLFQPVASSMYPRCSQMSVDGRGPEW